MDITVYLPDEIGERAKAAKLNLSAMLRAAVTAELERMDAMAQTMESAAEITLDLEDSAGRPYKGRFVGREIAEDVYVTDDERVLFYDQREGRVHEIEDPVEGLRDLCHTTEDYAEACEALGVVPVVDI